MQKRLKNIQANVDDEAKCYLSNAIYRRLRAAAADGALKFCNQTLKYSTPK